MWAGGEGGGGRGGGAEQASTSGRTAGNTVAIGRTATSTGEVRVYAHRYGTCTYACSLWDMHIREEVMKGCRDGASVHQVSVDRPVMGCVTSRAPIVEVRSIIRFTQGLQEFNVRNVELPQPTPQRLVVEALWGCGDNPRFTRACRRWISGILSSPWRWLLDLSTPRYPTRPQGHEATAPRLRRS